MTIGRGSNRIYTNQGQALKSQSNIRSGLGLPVCLPDVEMDVGVEDRSRYRQHLSAYLGSYLRNFTNNLLPGLTAPPFPALLTSLCHGNHGSMGILASRTPGIPEPLESKSAMVSCLNHFLLYLCYRTQRTTSKLLGWLLGTLQRLMDRQNG